MEKILPPQPSKIRLRIKESIPTQFLKGGLQMLKMTVWAPSSQAKVTLEYNYRHKRMSGKKFFHHSHHIRLRVKESKPTRFLKRWLQMLKMTVWAPSSQAKVTLKYFPSLAKISPQTQNVQHPFEIYHNIWKKKNEITFNFI